MCPVLLWYSCWVHVVYVASVLCFGLYVDCVLWCDMYVVCGVYVRCIIMAVSFACVVFIFVCM